MSDEHGMRYDNRYVVYNRDGDSTGWFVGIVVAGALLTVGYLVFSSFSQPKTTEEQVACMIANPGFSCEQVTRWEPLLKEEK